MFFLITSLCSFLGHGPGPRTGSGQKFWSRHTVPIETFKVAPFSLIIWPENFKVSGKNHDDIYWIALIDNLNQSL